MRNTDDKRPSMIRDLAAESAEMAADLPDLHVLIFGEDQMRFEGPPWLRPAVYKQEDLKRG